MLSKQIEHLRFLHTLHCAFQLGPPASMRVRMYVHLYSTYGYWCPCMFVYVRIYVRMYVNTYVQYTYVGTCMYVGVLV